MSKYSTKLSLDDYTVDGLMLRKIKKGSRVLELGCAAGKMTRYLKEELDCYVFIIEKCREDYEQAIHFADDGICGDILEFSWCEQLKGCKFDYILFADVLEHLDDPDKTMQKACGLLNDNGSIFVSVPNIAHNDILIKLFNNRFDYTSTGLLDDTHVHYWAPVNLESYFDKFGLFIVDMHYTEFPYGTTEQFRDQPLFLTRFEKNLLHERRYGDVYQFVLELRKETEYDEKHKIHINEAVGVPFFQTRIYRSRMNRGFDPEDYLVVKMELIEKGTYRLHYELSALADIEAVSIDPPDGQEVIWKDIHISQGGMEIVPEGCFRNGEKNMFYADEKRPQMFVPLLDRLHPLVIDMAGVVESETFYILLKQIFTKIITGQIS